MYCIDFFRKFKKDGNFCGLDKSEVSRLNAYLDIVELLMKQKIPEETVYTHLSVKAARPLLSAKGEERTEALNYVTSQLKEGKKISGTDLQSTMKSWTCPTSEPVSKPVQEKKPEQAKTGKPQKSAGFPDHVPPAAVTVPIPSDPAKPPQPSLAAQQAAKEMHVGHSSDVTVSPVIINDTLRQSPFRTGAEVKAHDKGPLGINAPPVPPAATPAPVINPKEEMERRARAFIELISSRLQLEATDLMRNHHWQAKDVLCFGIDALVENEGKQ